MLQTARRVLPLLGAAVALSFLVRSVRGRFLAVEVAGASMNPALESGDYVLVRRGGLPRDPAGLVAYLQGPEQRPMLKRVIGLPGESLRAGDHVEVNTRLLLEPYAQGEPAPHQYRAMHRLGADEYFVLGDRRDASTDSRDFGPIRASAIEGIAFARYWPPERLGRIRRIPRTFVDTDAPVEAAETESP